MFTTQRASLLLALARPNNDGLLSAPPKLKVDANDEILIENLLLANDEPTAELALIRLSSTSTNKNSIHSSAADLSPRCSPSPSPLPSPVAELSSEKLLQLKKDYNQLQDKIDTLFEAKEEHLANLVPKVVNAIHKQHASLRLKHLLKAEFWYGESPALGTDSFDMSQIVLPEASGMEREMTGERAPKKKVERKPLYHRSLALGIQNPCVAVITAKKDLCSWYSYEKKVFDSIEDAIEKTSMEIFALEVLIDEEKSRLSTSATNFIQSATEYKFTFFTPEKMIEELAQAEEEAPKCQR